MTNAARPRLTVADFSGNLRRDVYDAVTLDSQRVLTPEGYLVAPGNIARVGLQEYTAMELGLEVSDKVLRLYRPADEVFSEEALASFDSKPITYNHPRGSVTAENWRETAIGETCDPQKAADGTHVAACLTIRDKWAVEAVAYGKKELSCGYSFDLDMTPGTSPDGQAYDAVMRMIRGNHVALVDSARGGPECRIADTQRGGRTMALRKLTVDGFTCEMDEKDASIVERVIADSAKRLADAFAAKDAAEAKAKATDTALAAATEASTKAAAAHDAKVKELEAKVLSDEQFDARVEERAKVVADAKGILGEDFDAKGKSVAVIRLAALEQVVTKDEARYPGVIAVLGGVELAKADAAIVKIAFDAAVAVRAAGTGGGARGNPEQARAFAPDARGNAGGNKALSGRDLMIYRQNHGGKSPPSKDAA